MKRKYIYIILTTAIGLFVLWTGFLWKIFSCGIAGSYPCVKTWSLNVSESKPIEIINDLKKEHPELEPPNVPYPTSGRNSYWYDFTFYYEDTNENVQTWIRQNEDTTWTTIALVTISTHIDSLTPISEMSAMSTKEINRDYGYFQNKKEISKFESKILSLIRQKIHK